MIFESQTTLPRLTGGTTMLLLTECACYALNQIQARKALTPQRWQYVDRFEFQCFIKGACAFVAVIAAGFIYRLDCEEVNAILSAILLTVRNQFLSDAMAMHG